MLGDDTGLSRSSECFLITTTPSGTSSSSEMFGSTYAIWLWRKRFKKAGGTNEVKFWEEELLEPGVLGAVSTEVVEDGDEDSKGGGITNVGTTGNKRKLR